MAVSGRTETPNASHISGKLGAEPQSPSSPSLRAGLQGLVKEVAGYSVGEMLNRILGIAVACIYPILLSRDEYGRLDVIFSLTALFTTLLYAGMDMALQRFYYEYEAELQRRRLVSTVFCSVVGFTLIAVAVLLLGSKPLALWLYRDPRYVLYFRLLLCGMPFVMMNSIQLIVLRLERRIGAFVVLTTANLVTTAAFGMSSILFFGTGTSGVLLGIIFGNLATSAAGMWINRREICCKPLPGQMRKLMNIGLPLVISGTAVWLIGYVNRPILVHMVEADELGLYAIANGAAGMIALLIGAFRIAWPPFAFSIMGRKGSKDVYGHALTLFTVVGAIIAASASLFSSHALTFVNFYTRKDWSGAAPAIGPLAIGIVFSTMYFVVQTGAFIARRTSIIALTMGIAAAANIMLNFLLIPRFGILGAAMATALGYLAALIALYAVAQRLVPIPYSPGKLTAAIIGALIVMALSPHIHSQSIVKDLAVKVMILVFYCGALLAAGVVTRDDLSLFRDIGSQRRASDGAGCVEPSQIK